MKDWDAALEHLRRDYLRDAPARFDHLETVIEGLRRNPADSNAFRELRRILHNFAGSGATFGFPEMSRLSAQIEEECDALLREGVPSPDDVERWHTFSLAMRTEVSRPGTGSRTSVAAGRAPAEQPTDILVVDDDENICRFLETAFAREHAAVRTASTCTEARRALVESLPDAMLVDAGLPDGSGYDLIDHARDLPGADAMAVIMISARTGLLDKVEAIRCGADAFFEKPIDEAALASKLEFLLRRWWTAPFRILSVEDDPTYAAYLSALLSSAGYEVQTCMDPHLFETALMTFKPDLVLMDILLPEVTGYDLARFVRQKDLYATLPVLFLTTQRHAQARLNTMAAGGDDYLLKSDPSNLVLATVAARLERARLFNSLLERDGLTRLLTHTALITRASAVVALHMRHPERPAALTMLDVDHFKDVNDRYGHPVGDRVLAALAALLRRRLRQSDIIGRYGGEEFAVVMQEIDGAEAVRLASRLLEEFAAMAHAAPDGTTFRVTISAGVAGLEGTRKDMRRWFAEADKALYAAKAAGRNRVVAAPRDTI